MSGKVFVNYRQRDAADNLLPHALLVEALADRLSVHFGRETVYFDTTLRLGEPYPSALRARLAETEVLVVVIHSTWLADLADRAGRRTDWVHDEIADALANGIRLLPVVLAGASMPRHQDLPETIREMANVQGIKLPFGSLAARLDTVVAEIELVVAPSPPGPVVTVEPPPDRSSLGAALGVLLLCVLVGAAGAATELAPFPELSAVWTAILFAVVLTFFLLIILAVSGSRFALRGPMNWLDERLARTANRAFVVFGVGVCLLGLLMTALMVVGRFGLSTDSVLLLMITIVMITVGFMGVVWLRNQERTPDWPAKPVAPEPYWVRRACVELETRLNAWQAPLPLARQQDAQVALAGIRAVVATMTAPEEVGLFAWWRKRSPWVTLTHAGLVAAALVMAILALVLDWVAGGPDVVSVLWWLGAVVVIAGAHVGAVAFEYGYYRAQIDAVGRTVEDRLASMDDRLAVLSRPGLIAAHCLRFD
ncbi:MAG: hypothetical protein ACRDSK_16080 [Actinophytocola sp.]|uniref:hypothetical protein n=1 Tax=Actinophytocola sp. TaxID=1872138 RepID=UPI003D6B62A1